MDRNKKKQQGKDLCRNILRKAGKCHHRSNRQGIHPTHSPSKGTQKERRNHPHRRLQCQTKDQQGTKHTPGNQQ